MIEDDRRARNQLLALTMVRLGGIMLIGLGLLIGLTSHIIPGGSRLGGAFLIVVGTLDTALIPLVLQRAWSKD